jgi:hypothetical protein
MAASHSPASAFAHEANDAMSALAVALAVSRRVTSPSRASSSWEKAVAASISPPVVFLVTLWAKTWAAVLRVSVKMIAVSETLLPTAVVCSASSFDFNVRQTPLR